MLVPLSIIATGLKVVLEILRTFNNLPEDLRNPIVRDIMKDKKIRDDWWRKVTSGWDRVIKKVDVTK